MKLKLPFMLGVSALVHGFVGCKSRSTSFKIKETEQRASSSGSDIFEGKEMLPLKLKAPFAILFSQREKVVIGEIEEATVDGILELESEGNLTSVPVQVSLRGNTSLEICRFPKLNIKLKTVVESGLLKGIKKLRIGTHCDVDPNGDNRFNRLSGDLPVVREYLAYQFFSKILDVAHRSRVLNVTYDFGDGSAPVVKKALLSEHKGMIEKRIAGKEVEFVFPENFDERFKKMSEFREMIRLGINRNEAVLIEIGNAILGNGDYNFEVASVHELPGRTSAGVTDLFNVTLFKLSDNSFKLVPNDFDLAATVIGPNISTTTAVLDGVGLNEFDKLESRLFAHLLMIRNVYKADLFNKAVQLINSKIENVESLSSDPLLDAEGKSFFVDALIRFKKVIGSPLLDTSHLKTVGNPLKVTSEPNGSNVICVASAAILPIKVLEVKQELTRFEFEANDVRNCENAGGECKKSTPDACKKGMVGWVRNGFVTSK